MAEDEQTTQNPQTGGTMRAEDHPRLTVTEEEWERMVPLTIERVTQANQNPRSRLSAVPGRSGSSEVYRGLRILKSGMPRVTAEELERASKWEADFKKVEYEGPPSEVPVTRRTLELPEFREEVESLCPECSKVSPGEICTCELGAIDARLLTPAPRNKVFHN